MYNPWTQTIMDPDNRIVKVWDEGQAGLEVNGERGTDVIFSRIKICNLSFDQDVRKIISIYC